MKKNNKGFSLVELIIVIAIMAVLIGVLAPQFIKYVEQGRRSTDITNAENIRTAILADIADGLITTDGSNATFVDRSAATPPTYSTGTIGASTIATAPDVAGNLATGGFLVTWDVTNGECSVSLTDGTTTWVLTDATQAQTYKNAD